MEFSMDDPKTRQRIERLPAVMERTGLARATLYALIAEKKFCKPVKLSARAIGFLSDEVDEWIAQRVAQRDRTTA
jgi:prophage regulatory protein